MNTNSLAPVDGYKICTTDGLTPEDLPPHTSSSSGAQTWTHTTHQTGPMIKKKEGAQKKRMEYGHPCQLYLPCLLAAKPSPCLIIQNLSISSGLRPGMRPAIRSHLQRPTPRHLVSVVRTSHLKELPCLDCVTLASPQGTFLFIGFSWFPWDFWGCTEAKSVVTELQCSPMGRSRGLTCHPRACTFCRWDLLLAPSCRWTPTPRCWLLRSNMSMHSVGLASYKWSCRRQANSPSDTHRFDVLRCLFRRLSMVGARRSNSRHPLA